ncbi:copper resistance CopC family protein [Phytoactinopolyspora limicola]|uniref:copper resistance CopC family protein n=1 Tax=Phytoactinopolyspora limicola TaxID=2715536 RepID=UPI001407C990|nr:copper resistance CopC family protein [Phytoactinopolyspora limicola]
MTAISAAACRSRTRRRATALVTGLAVAAATMITATPATAHNVLIDTIPDDGSTVTSQPDTVELVFDQYVQDTFAQVAVIDADENPYQVGEPEVDFSTVRQDVGDLPDGDYTVSYRVISADGHPVSGTFTFTLAAGGDTAEDDTAVSDDDTAVSDDDTAVSDDDIDDATNDNEATPAEEATEETPDADTTPAADDSGSGPGALVAALVIVAIVAIAGVVLALRRRARPAGPDRPGDDDTPAAGETGTR